jgi:peptidyl-dipeptidase Dcp
MIRNFRHATALSAALLLAACFDSAPEQAMSDTSASNSSGASSDVSASSPPGASSDNPLLGPSALDLGYPPFDRIEDHHYRPAFEAGMAEQLEEIEAIANLSDAPTFDNTLVAMERSGRTLNRTSSVFFGMTGAHTNDTIEAIQAEMAPRLSAHNDRILLNSALFARIETLYEQRRSLGLGAEDLRLIEETHRDFVRAGAKLSEPQKEGLRAINTELAELAARFSQNVLGEVNALAVVVDSRDELAGLSNAQIKTAADAAASRDMPGKFLLPLLNTSQQPVLSALEDRALRERIFKTSVSRGHRGGEYDNREIVSRTARLRAQRAQLLGYANHAAYVLDKETAKTMAAVNGRLASLTPPAVANAEREAADLQRMIDAEGGNFELAPWDWNFYAEKLRQERYAFDESQLSPYFELDNVLKNGVFYAAGQIYRLRFEERFDLPVYQEDVRVFEVFDADGSTLSLFIFDPYARPSKRGGAWMRAYVSQSHLLDKRAVVANHANITEPSDGEPALLTLSEVTTLFHEFGHALHGMFSDVTYPSFAGTSVPRDFVEYPSQVNEMWVTWPDVLKNYARHYETGEPMPSELLDKVLASQKFNQGYATTEYLAAALIDQALYQLEPAEVPSAEELMAFEADTLRAAGAGLAAVPPRYRLPYFSHIMGGYSAGYYSYIWSEVLDADTVEWFKANGGMTRANGQHFRDTLLSKGGSVDAMTLFRQFRGQEPDIAPLLERRGLN